MTELASIENKAKAGIARFEQAYNLLLKQRPGILGSEWGGELQWLKDARERDFGRWCTEGLPTKRNEKWHYTNLTELSAASIAIPTPGVLPPRSTFSCLRDDAADIVFLNGQYIPDWSRLAELGPDVSAVVLTELLEECVESGWSAERIHRFAEFRKHVETSDADRETVFAAMNTSFMQDGVLIHVRKGARLEKPIVIAYLSYFPEAAPASATLTMTSPRIFVQVDSGAEVALLEFYEGKAGQRYFANAVSDLRLEENSRLSYCKVQLEGDEGLHIGTTRIHQKRSSFSEAFQFSFGAKLSRQDLHISLEGEGAECALDGVYMVAGRQHVDNHTSVDHLVPHTTSSQVYKGLLDGEARAVFNGFVHIHRDAQKSSAAQLNNNLVLSPKAEVDTKPELEIDADDVKASHGATIGRLDPEHVFYLETRAIPKEEAVRILARGFLQDVTYRIRNAHLRKRVHAIVEQRFAGSSVQHDAK